MPVSIRFKRPYFNRLCAGFNRLHLFSRVWQHVVCMGISWNQIPEEYQCEKCQPRYIDKKRAVEIQKKKIAEKLCIGVNDDSDSSDAPAPSKLTINYGARLRLSSKFFTPLSGY